MRRVERVNVHAGWRLAEAERAAGAYVGNGRRVEAFYEYEADTDPEKHMRLAAVQRCQPLSDADLIAGWRARADTYPDALVFAMVRRWLDEEALPGWAAREALVHRGDEIAAPAGQVAAAHAGRADRRPGPAGPRPWIWPRMPPGSGSQSSASC